MPELDTFRAMLLYIPLSIIGLWRWSYWLIRRIGAVAYRPKVKPWPEDQPRPSVSIVTPVYNEDPDLFDEALRSWQRNGVDEVVAVIDKSNSKHIMRCDREYVRDQSSATKFRMIVTPKPGKRAALCDGIVEASGDFIVLVDSDTTWDDDVLERTIPYFRNPAIGGATVAQRISNPNTVGNVLFDILLWTRYHEEVPFLLGVGRVFNTLSGRTAFYRREAILNPDHDNIHDLRHETFLGTRAISGDDKRLTHLIIRQGWETAFVLGPTVCTPGLGSLKNFLKQRLRWTRNSWRADLRAVGQGWVFAHPALAFFMIDRFFLPLFMLVGPAVFILSLLNHEWLFAGVLLTWWFTSRFVRVFGYFKGHPKAVVYLPAYMVYGFVNAVLKIYALGTLMENSWATRWHKKRAARRSRLRKVSTLLQGSVALAACAFLLTQIALSFRQQVGADVVAQPTFDATNLAEDVDVYKDPPVGPLKPSAEDIRVYTVRPGDTLFSLSLKLGTSVKALQKTNHIDNGDLISVGQELIYVKRGT